MTNRYLKILLLTPLLLGAILFFRTIFFGMVWDDEAFIRHPLLHSNVIYLKDAVHDAFSGFVLSKHLYWRPLTSLSFWASNLSCPISEPPNEACLLVMAHYINYFMYLMFCLISPFVALGLVSVFKKESFSLSTFSVSTIVLSVISSLLITLHPLNIEIFAWISGRFDAFLLLFMMLSMGTLFLTIHTLAKGLLLFVFCSLAHMSKDGAAIGYVILAFICLHLPITNRQRSLLVFSILSAIVSMSLLRFYTAGPIQISAVLIDTLHVRLIFERYISSTAQILMSLVQPWAGVSPAHPFRLGLQEYVYSFLFHAGLITVTSCYLRSLLKRTETLLLWCLGLCFFSFLTMTALLNAYLTLNQDFVWAERYFASGLPFLLGFISIGLHLLYQNHAASKKKIAASGFIISAFALASIATQIQEIKFWDNNISFWSRVLLDDPKNIKSLNNYARMIFQDHREPEALLYAQTAQELLLKQKNELKLAEDNKSLTVRIDPLQWQLRAYDMFSIRAQFSTRFYMNGKCDEGDIQYDEAIFLSQFFKPERIQSTLNVLNSFKKQCRTLDKKT